MGAMLTAGAGTTPTRTVWMSPLADNFTMLLPINESGGNKGKLSTSTSAPPCLLPGSFNFFNSSAGASATAPDGTGTAQKIVEDGSSGVQHYIGGAFNNWQPLWPVMRVAGIFKAAERTRVAFQSLDFNGNTVACGFDLAGGQIAYGATTSGSPVTFSISNQTIFPVGSGFYLCYADYSATSSQAQGISNGLVFRICLDNGSGIAAANLSYNGNNSFGLIGWKQSVLPAQSWSINNTTFFDDFTTLATVDVNNTQATGFNWYVQGGSMGQVSPLQGWFTGGTWAPGDLTISNSVITLPARTALPGRESPYLTSFCAPGPAGIPPGVNAGVGTGWRPPFMYETRLSWNYNNFINGPDITGPWFAPLEWVSGVAAGKTTLQNVNGAEFDPYENLTLLGPQTGILVYNGAPLNQIGGYPMSNNSIAVGSAIKCYIGQPIFSTALTTAGFQYSPNDEVSLSGSPSPIYRNGSGGGTGATPPAAPWVSETYPTAGTDPMIQLDFTQMHKLNLIILPYNWATKDHGCMLQFFDGAYRCGVSWTPNPVSGDASNTYLHAIDWQRLFAMYSSTFNVTGSGYDMHIDYAKVMQ